MQAWGPDRNWWERPTEPAYWTQKVSLLEHHMREHSHQSIRMHLERKECRNLGACTVKESGALGHDGAGREWTMRGKAISPTYIQVQWTSPSIDAHGRGAWRPPEAPVPVPPSPLQTPSAKSGRQNRLMYLYGPSCIRTYMYVCWRNCLSTHRPFTPSAIMP